MVETDGESQLASLQLRSYYESVPSNLTQFKSDAFSIRLVLLKVVENFERQSMFTKDQSLALSAYKVTLKETHKKLKKEDQSLNNKLKQVI